MVKHDTPRSMLIELLAHLKYDSELRQGERDDPLAKPYGTLIVSREPDALYARCVAVLGFEPDVINTVMRPAIEAELPLRNPAYDTSDMGIFDDYTGCDGPNCDHSGCSCATAPYHPKGEGGCYLEFCDIDHFAWEDEMEEFADDLDTERLDDETFPPEEADVPFGAGLECQNCGEIGCICSDRT